MSVNTFININDVCDIPGTMCARLASLGIQWTSISYVCVDFNWVPSMRLMVRGFLLIFISETFVPERTKFPVDPESETAISTAILMFDALKIVSAFGGSRKLLFVIFSCHAFAHMGITV